jgi:hypothetical protein
MSSFKGTSLDHRLSAAANAKKTEPEKFRTRSGTNDPVFAERQAARRAVSVARDARTAERNASRLAGVAREAAEKAAHDVAVQAERELDDAMGLTDTGAHTLADARTGKNGRHRLGGLLRQSVFGRLAGYEDVNDADRRCRDPAMRWVVGDRAITGLAASASQMGRVETAWLTRPQNLAALIDLPAGGSTRCMHAVRRRSSSSTWIRASA